MNTIPSSRIHQVPAAFTPDQLHDFSERDVGRTITIRMRPALYEPVDARICSVDSHFVPLFAMDEAAAAKVLESVSLKQSDMAAEFIAETQQAIVALRSELSELDQLRRIAARDEGHLKEIRESLAKSKKKRGPGNTRTKRLKTIQKAADQLAGALRALTDLDRLDLEERSPFNRARLDQLTELVASLSTEFKTNGRRGLPIERPHEHDFVGELAICFHRFVGKPSHTRESATEGYVGQFEKYVRSVVEAIRPAGITIGLDIPYLVRSASERVKAMVGGGVTQS